MLIVTLVTFMIDDDKEIMQIGRVMKITEQREWLIVSGNQPLWKTKTTTMQKMPQVVCLKMMLMLKIEANGLRTLVSWEQSGQGLIHRWQTALAFALRLHHFVDLVLGFQDRNLSWTCAREYQETNGMSRSAATLRRLRSYVLWCVMYKRCTSLQMPLNAK